MNAVLPVAAGPQVQIIRKHYRMTSNADAMRQLIRVISEVLPRLPVRTETYSDKNAPVTATSAVAA